MIVAVAAQEPSSGAAAPPAVRWQRNLADAEAVARAKSMPLLLCVNVNGEPASERLARRQYRDPKFAALAAGFVAVIASPDRHTPRDHDAAGRRIPCPRFGCVTCGEHIAVEPLLFDKYFAGQRVAPRHVGIGADGTRLFDIFLANDLQVIDDALAKHGKPAGPPWPARDSRSREAAEASYLEGDAQRRLAMLRKAADDGSESFELLRLGAAEGDGKLRQAAVAALAEAATPAAQPLLIEVLDDTVEPAVRTTLVPALARVADDEKSTKLALHVHRSLGLDPQIVDVDAWQRGLRGAEAPPPPAPDDDLEAQIDALADRARSNPEDGAVRLELARATLRFALQRQAAGHDPQFLLIDARQAAEQALELGAAAAAPLAADLAYRLGDRSKALEHARRAVPALLAAGELAGESALTALTAVAEGAAAAIYAAEGAGAPWDGGLLADGHAAYRVIAHHPLGTGAHAAAHADLLAFLGARGLAIQALQRGVARFCADGALHDKLIAYVGQVRGLAAVPAAYGEVADVALDRATFQWFFGKARLAVAEHHKREGDDAAAAREYDAAIASLDESVSLRPEYRASADWYAALAEAGRARVHLDCGELQQAVAMIGAALRRHPQVAEQQDGLGRTPLFTLKQIRAAVAGDADLVANLQAAVSAVDPSLWERAIQ